MVLVLCSGPALARQVTDHLGRVVQIPDHPQRIVSLHDWTLTVMATELGAPLVGSVGRVTASGGYTIRGAHALFGLDFSHIALASVHGQPDLERINSLHPDLILANVGDYGAYQQQLARIAPTLFFDAQQGKPVLQLYRDVAGWLGRMDRFRTLDAAYWRKVRAVRRSLALTQGAKAPTYAAVLANGRDGTVQVLGDYGVLTVALDAVGLRRMPIVRHIPKGRDRMTIGAEWLDSIDADILVTAAVPQAESSSEVPLSQHAGAVQAGAQALGVQLNRIMPGASGFLHAFRRGQVMSFSRYEVYPPSFKGLMMTLDAVESALHSYRPSSYPDGTAVHSTR